MKPYKRFIFIILISAVVGALMGRIFPLVGLVISLIAGIGYVAVNFKHTVLTLRNFKHTNPARKLKSVVIILFAASMLSSVFTQHFPYFMLLIVLAIDFRLFTSTAQGSENQGQA